ncbi:unnamed protein product [Allacma fusca]|uniref:WAP domain-containing protein n=1 Tax=Allacma fusca TaxID=39272 RepID=A0A8J2PDF3_9HEXA|nr:unnamed protein product [Allacma fusca]
MRKYSLILVLAALAIYSVKSQFGLDYRNYFGLAIRSQKFSQPPEQCLSDGSLCKYMTDCCSLHCSHGSWISPNECAPSFCGCPQPPWSTEPPYDNCLDFHDYCSNDRQCCSGFCYQQSSARGCWYPPCIPCD